MGHYEQGQVCLNGHAITGSYPSGSSAKFCDQCGAETIITCPGCRARIRGNYEVPDYIGLSDFVPPAYCADCGAPFPWTVSRLEAARELATDQDRLSVEERAQLAATLPDLVRDVPMTPVAAGRFKRLVLTAAVSGDRTAVLRRDDSAVLGRDGGDGGTVNMKRAPWWCPRRSDGCGRVSYSGTAGGETSPRAWRNQRTASARWRLAKMARISST